MPVSTTFDSTPQEYKLAENAQRLPDSGIGDEAHREQHSNDEKVRQYIMSWRNQLRQYRYEKLAVWNECWQLYRGQDNFADLEDWQSKIVLPKSWSSVKQATNVIKRLLNAAQKPFNLESENPNDMVTVLRAEQMTNLARVFLEEAKFYEEFSEGLECSFIMGCGVWKVWWGLVPKQTIKVTNTLIPMPPGQMGMPQPQMQAPTPEPQPGSQSVGALNPRQPQAPQPGVPGAPTEQQPLGGGVPIEGIATNRTAQPVGQAPRALQHQDVGLYPPQQPGEFINPMNLPGPPGAESGGLGLPALMQQFGVQKQIVREESVEGRLFIRAVDPYNFYWLPGSKMNRWTGTIEEIELPKWQLMEMAEQGIFDKKLVAEIQPMKIEETTKQSWLRFGEMPRTTNGPNVDTGVVKLTEYYGPIVLDGEIIDKYGHVLIANDYYVLINQSNQFWTKKSPYVGFSPLGLPFRTEGVGLIEQVRQIDKALNRIANLSVDTLMFRLMPLFEVNTDAFENPEDFETGMTPGKLFRRNMTMPGVQGIKPIEMQDISQGSLQVSTALDRAHQEGSLVTELQESLPRWKGNQTATETQIHQQNKETFMGGIATDIEMQAIRPIVMMAIDLIFQFLNTSQDPRVASILGIEGQVLQGMSREEILELIQGEYKVHVTGLSSQLDKADMLQNLVQFMNLIGQNPQAWLPFINQNALLRRILEAFRPAIHDIEQIIADPETVAANRAAMMEQEAAGGLSSDMLRMLPQLITTYQSHKQQAIDNHSNDVDQALQIARLSHDRDVAAKEHQARLVDAQASLNTNRTV